MSQLVKLVEQRDYVEQVADAADTRAKVIRLTKRGIALQGMRRRTKGIPGKRS